ncbi:MAG TPA: MBL fold metallo-hydrolase [Hyphomicrobium sp.]|jgi:glyoxylase-like metal-dependent hydrolase (beta-lactamase superfamily II)|uniref:MBL fold metallo-hydrolase n=1 Tax=Hyphomicrobium sp. TaxID=82 RepID=UPI002C447E10|nr:MBL fold metallo-hydrolase [Hyphomicrobium sp.]HXE01775.1 MBL fold metallo-hydrolase [Hyphomicrobium sp.]
MTQPNAAPGSPLKAAIVRVTPFEQNCTLIWDEATKVGAVVDPGGDLERIEQAIKQTGISIEKILLTHGHIDHAGGADELREKLGVKIEGPHKNDVILLDNLEKQGKVYGVDGVRNVTPDRWLEEGDRVTVAGHTFEIFHCPGHSPGSVVFFDRAQRFALVGDVLFRGSIGRTDFPYGDHAALISSIKSKLLPLGDDIAFICGHGEPGQFGPERLTNPFLV